VYGSRKIGAKQRYALTNIIVLAAMSMLVPDYARADCAPPADGPPMCLAGTIMSRGYTAALLEPAGKQETDALRPGAQLLDWRVLEIKPRTVLLGRDERQVRLTLDDHGKGEPAAGEVEIAAPSESIAARSAKLRAERKRQRSVPTR
jgi:hypothetical protein